MAPLTFLPLQTRPPTPPKHSAKTTEHALRFLEDYYDLGAGLEETTHHHPINIELDTPPQSSPVQPNSATSKQLKQLRFLPPEALPEDGDVVLRPLPPSKGQRSFKSILKPFDPSPSHDQSDGDPFKSLIAPIKNPTFGDMLECIVKQLTRPDLSDRMNAYQTLCSSLAAFDGLPDPVAIREKLPLLEEFIRRDIVDRQTGITFKRLPLQAAKLTNILLSAPGPPLRFNSDFLSFLLDQSITILSQKQPPKDLALQCMLLVSSQAFYSKSVLGDRAPRIIAALSEIQTRISGNSVNQGRIMIYKSFLHCSSSALLEKPENWLSHIFHGMLSDNKDFRSRAIDTAVTAGEAIGNTKIISQAVFTLLNTEGPEGIKYHSHFEQRLRGFLQIPEDCRHVPQIWGAVMLLLRGNQRLVETWFNTSSWLRIIEGCFNAGDTKLNFDAWLAWNRTIFAIGAMGMNKPPIVKRLRIPVGAQLQRQLPGKVKEAAFSTFCALSYYAFGPSTGPDGVTTCWKLLIGDLLPTIVARNPADAHHLAQILSAMFANSSLRVWNVDRASDVVQNPFKLDEVPRLDPQWIRKNISLVSPALLPLLLALWCSPVDREKPLQNLWTSFMKAIAEASSKEIKLSMESKTALAEVTNILYRLWKAVFPRRNNSRLHRGPAVATFMALVQSAVEILGPIHFADNVLLRTESGIFEATATPTRSTSGRSGQIESPIIAILRLITMTGLLTGTDDSLEGSLKNALRPCWEAKASRRLKIDFMKECAGLLSTLNNEATVMNAGAQLWHCIADLTKQALDEEVPAIMKESGHQLGNEYRNVIVILQHSLNFSDRRSLAVGSDVLEHLRRCARREAGEGAVVLAVTEPLVNCLQVHSLGCCHSSALHYAASIFATGLTVPSKQAIEKARKALWHNPRPIQDENGLNWLETVYSMTNELLKSSYLQLSVTPDPVLQHFLTALAKFLRGQSGTFKNTIPGPELFLWNLKDGIGVWVEDKDGKVFGPSCLGSEIRSTVVKMWEAVLHIISTIALKGHALLAMVESLLCSGMQTRSKNIANLSIILWNTSFGEEDQIDYPPQLERLLRRLRGLVEINLPTFPVQAVGYEASTASENKLDEDDTRVFPWLVPEESSPLEDAQVSKTPVALPSSSRPRNSLFVDASGQKPSTPQRMRKSQIMQKTPPTRLRHDDSQVQFVAVESSPVDPSALESQMLTEHQKDVRTRQLADVALFKDLRSSPLLSTPGEKGDSLMAQVNEMSPPRVALSSIDLPLPDHPSPASGDEGDDMSDSSPLAPSRLRNLSPQALSSIQAAQRIKNADKEANDMQSSPPQVQDEEQPHDAMTPATNQENNVLSVLCYPDLPSSTIVVPATKLSHQDTEADDSHHSAEPIVHIREAEQNKEPAAPTSYLPSLLSDSPMEGPTKLPSNDLVFITEDAVETGNPQLSPTGEPRTEAVNHDVSNTPATQIPIDSPSVITRDSSEEAPPNATVSFIEDSIFEHKTERRSLSRRIVFPVQDSGHPVPQPLVNSLPEKNAKVTPRKTQRMIATHVLIPQSTRKQTPQSTNDNRIKSQASADSRGSIRVISESKKRSSTSQEPIAKKQKTSVADSDKYLIVCRTPGPYSSSLRSLAQRSTILVDGKDLQSSSAVKVTTVPNSQLQNLPSRKRSLFGSEENEEINPNVESRSGQLSERAPKRPRFTSPIQVSSEQNLSQLSQRRSSRLSGGAPALERVLTPTSRRRKTPANGSPLASVNTSFQEHELQSIDVIPEAAGPSHKQPKSSFEIDAREADIPVMTSGAFIYSSSDDAGQTDKPSRVQDHNTSSDAPKLTSLNQPSPWDDTTVDITANLAQTTSPVPAQVTNVDKPTPPTSHPAQDPAATSEPPQQSQPEPTSPSSLARSIIGRLRGLLVDCRKLVLGPQEEREGEVEELQDMAHELQGEILRAARRGRA